jgi:hypothetical protein
MSEAERAELEISYRVLTKELKRIEKLLGKKS